MTSIEALIDRQLTRRQVFGRAPKLQASTSDEKPRLIRVITIDERTRSAVVLWVEGILE